MLQFAAKLIYLFCIDIKIWVNNNGIDSISSCHFYWLPSGSWFKPACFIAVFWERNFYWQIKSINTVAVPVHDHVFFYLVFKHRYVYVSQILVKYFTKVDPAFFADIVFHLFSGNSFVPEGCIHSSQYLPEQGIVVDHLPDSMNKVSAFWIHVTAAFFVYSIRSDNGGFILYAFSLADNILTACLFAIMVFSKKQLLIFCKGQ